MKKQFELKLLPYYIKRIGFIGICLTVATFFTLVTVGLSPEAKTIAKPLIQLFLIISLLFIIFSKEKQEDEFIKQLRTLYLARTAIAFFALAALEIILHFIFPEEQGSTSAQMTIMLETFYIISFRYNKHYLGEYE